MPPQQEKPQGERPRKNDHSRMMEAIVYITKTGVQWKALPQNIAAGSSAHDRF
ncbi:MAG: transposase [Candidatus Jettenia sp.]|nr:transposase [Candidatus Jettenia sp.]